MNLVVTILAAGEGKRMKSDLPKVLHLCKGKPMLVRIIETALQLSPSKLIVVTGKYHELIKETISKYLNIESIQFIQQRLPIGTGYAVYQCVTAYDPGENVLILNGDMPLIQGELLNKVIKNTSNAKIVVAKLADPTGYGRIIYNNDGEFIDIVEEKDCDTEQKHIDIVNVGIYIINSMLLKKYIPKIRNQNAQGEYYLTDIVKILKAENINIDTHLIDESENKLVLGVNTQEELGFLDSN